MNEHDDALRAAYTVNARLRQRWYEALEDGERFREEAQAARDLIRSLRRELDATYKAKSENDERFQLEAARAREERDVALEEVRKLRAENEALRVSNQRLRDRWEEVCAERDEAGGSDSDES